MDIHTNPILATFNQLGKDASYHFADDTGKEWQRGYALQTSAYHLWYAHPELHPEMREIATGFIFLWNPPDRRAETVEVRDAYEMTDATSKHTNTADDCHA